MRPSCAAHHLTGLLIASLALAARSAVIQNDTFPYTNGPLAGSFGSPWVVHSTGAQPCTVTNGQVQLTGAANAEDVNVSLSGQPYAPAGGAMLYASFRVTFTALPTAGGTYFAHFKDAGTGFSGRVWASTSNAPAGLFRLGIGNSSSATNTSGQLETNLGLNTPYTIVSRYNVGTGVGSLWLNPLSEASPSVTATDPVSTITVTSFALRQGTGAGTTLIDDLRMGTSFSDITEVVGKRIVGVGANTHGQIDVPFALTNVAAISGGESHSLAQLSSGSVLAWGRNDYGQTNVPTSVTNARAIAAGGFHNVVLSSNGNIFVWGNNDYGQVSRAPVTLTDIKAIAAGFNHCALSRSNGLVVAWGDNSAKQTNVPAGLNTVKAIACGADHCLALKSNGTVVAWGSNLEKQTNVPSGLSSVLSIAAGGAHSVALRSNGTVVAWGDNTYGQTNPPAGLSNIMAIAAGRRYSLALKTNGQVVAWGQVATAGTVLSNAVAIAAGAYHWLALIPANSPLNVPPTNDAFAQPSLLSGDSNFIVAANLGATRELDEPVHGCVPGLFNCPPSGKASVWYAYTAPTNGTLDLRKASSSIQLIMAAYAGNSLSNLTRVGDNYVYPSGSQPGGFLNRIRFNVGGGTTYFLAVDALGGEQGEFNLFLSFRPAPVNDPFLSKSTVISPVTTLFGSVLGARDEVDEPPLPKFVTASIWWSWAPPSDMPVFLSTFGSSEDTVLDVFTSDSLANLVDLVGNDDAFDFPEGSGLQRSPDDTTSRVRFDAVGGEMYQIRVSARDRYGSGPGRVALNFTTLAIEDILSLSRTLQANSTMTFSATLKISNLLPRTTGPLRVRVIAAASHRLSDLLRYDLDYVGSLNTPSVGLATFALPSPGAITGSNSVQVTVSGTCPAQMGNGAVKTNWNAVGILEERVNGTWVERDARLIAPQLYPGGDGLTGGGVSLLSSGLAASLFAAGNFRVLLEPSAELSTNAGWRILQTTDQRFYNDNTTVYGLPVGTNYTLTFLTAAGFLTPSNRSLTVLADQTNTLVVAYTNLSPMNPICSFSNGIFHLRFTASGGLRYVLERSTNLVNWTSLTTNQVSSDGFLDFTNSGLTGMSRAFYRARWLP